MISARKSSALAAEAVRTDSNGFSVGDDSQPDNVLVSRDGRVLVTDFGLVLSLGAVGETGAADEPEPAAQGDTSRATPLTQTGMAVGTPAYMAPEQLISNKADPRSDQYSFCIALYEACYRVAPFEGKAGKERLEQLAQAEAACQQAMQLTTEAGADDTPQRATVLRGLANLKFQQDHLEEALSLFAQSISRQERHYAVQHPMVAATLREQAAAYLAQGRAAEASHGALRSLVIDEQSFGAAHFELAEALNLLATIRLARGDPEQAILYARRALSGTRASLPEGHPRIAIAAGALGDVLYRAGHFGEALEQHRAALASLEPTSDEVHAAAAALGVAEDLLATGQEGQALPMLQWGFHSRALADERMLLGRRQFAWARALRAVGPKSQYEHAADLARAAQKSYQELGSQARRERAEVADWLAKNPVL